MFHYYCCKCRNWLQSPRFFRDTSRQWTGEADISSKFLAFICNRPSFTQLLNYSYFFFMLLFKLQMECYQVIAKTPVAGLKAETPASRWPIAQKTVPVVGGFRAPTNQGRDFSLLSSTAFYNACFCIVYTDRRRDEDEGNISINFLDVGNLDVTFTSNDKSLQEVEETAADQSLVWHIDM